MLRRFVALREARAKADRSAMLRHACGMTLRPDRYSRRGGSDSQFLIAAKNPRIVLAPRVPVITRLGEFRVRHEMSLLRMREAREREKEGTLGRWSSRGTLDHPKGRAVAIPGACPFSAWIRRRLPFFPLSFLPLYFTHSRRDKGARPARSRSLIFLLNCSRR